MWIGCALALLAALAWAEGVRRLPVERAGLDACAGHASAAVAGSDVRLAAISSYIAPAVGVGTADLDTGLRRLVSEQARRARGPVDEALRTCRDLVIWPLNDDHRAARSAYLDLLEAQRSHLGSVITDGLPYGPGYDEVAELRREAESRWP